MDDTKKEINNCIKEYIDQNGNKKKYDGWVDLTTLKSSRHPNGNPENKQPDVTPDLIIENAIMDICRYDLTRIGIHTFDKLHKLLPNITKETYDRVVSNLTGANIFKSPENFKKYNDIVTHSTNIKAMVIGDIHGTHTKVEVLNLIKNVIK